MVEVGAFVELKFYCKKRIYSNGIRRQTSVQEWHCIRRTVTKWDP